MIARFAVLLPFSFSIQEGLDMKPVEIEQEGYRILIHPPCQGSLANPIHPLMPNAYDLPATEIRLTPALAPFPVKALNVNGRSTIVADLIVIDFFAQDFDRRKDSGGKDSQDQLVKIAFVLTDQMIDRLRLVTRSPWAKPVAVGFNSWRVDYCNDDGSELPAEADLIRGHSAFASNMRITHLSEEIWSLAWKEPNSVELRNWDKLLLDAVDLIDEMGAAIAVANSGIEAFAIWMNNLLASSSTMDMELWKWIEDRDHFQQNPSVKDRFDVILKTFTGHSLKENPELWQVLTDLRKARNSFMHEGAIRIAKNREVLSKSEAHTLVSRSLDIVTWVEELLPAEHRRFIRKEDMQIEYVLQKGNASN